MDMMESASPPERMEWFRLTIGNALYSDNEELVKRLVKAAPDVVRGMRTRLGDSALCAAVASGNLAVISTVLEAGVDLDETSGDECTTALVSAIKHGFRGVAWLLLEKGADVNVTDRFTNSALHFACDDGDHRLVGDLLRAGAKRGAKNSTECTPLHRAVMCRNAEMVSVLLSGEDGRKAMVDATNVTGNSALTLAVGFHNVPMVAALLDGGASVDVVYNTWVNGVGSKKYPLLYLTTHHLELTKLLLSHGASVHMGAGYENGFTALHWAVHSGTSAVLQHLTGLGRGLEKRFGSLSRDGRDFSGGTALHVAVLNGETRGWCADLLIEKGADVNALDSAGFTPLAALCHAFTGGDVKWRVEIAHVLLRAGADETIGGPGGTPVELIGDVIDPAGALRGLLLRASAWRRRKLWVLCRAIRGERVTFEPAGAVFKWLVGVGEEGVFRCVMSFV